MNTQITFRNMTPSAAVRARIEERAEKLTQFHDRIISCRVVVQAPHRRHVKGKLYSLSIDLKLPGREIAASRQAAEHHAHEDVYVAVRDAFDAVERRLEDTARRRRGEVKTHDADGAQGAVVKLLAEQNYGFIRTPEGDEVYFHANSVVNGGFGRLKVGDKVHLVTETGEKGLQASTVRRLSGRRAAAE